MKCKNCGNDLNGTEKFCKYCGTMVEFEKNNGNQEDLNKSGSFYNENFTQPFDFNSTNNLTQTQNQPADMTPKTKKKRKIIILSCACGAAVVILLIAVLVFVSASNSNRYHTNESTAPTENVNLTVYSLNNIEFTAEGIDLQKNESGYDGVYKGNKFIVSCRVLNKYVEKSDREDYLKLISEEHDYGDYGTEQKLDDFDIAAYMYDFNKADLYIFENENELYSMVFENANEKFDTEVRDSILNSLRCQKSDFTTEPTTEKPTEKVTEQATEKHTEPPAKSISTSKANALESAKSYLRSSEFSYEGLIDQLEYEQYSHEDAVYAADNCGADWNEQALKCAKSYLSFSSFSRQGLIEQLEYEKYTNEQAVYAVDNCNADWYEQAVKTAESYLDFSSFSRDGLINQLEFEGFTHDQAVYGAEQNGY